MDRIPPPINGNDPNYFDKTWQIVEDFINELYSHNADELTSEDNDRLSTHVSGLLSYDKEMVYIAIVDTITSNVNKISIYMDGVQEAGLFLEELNRNWKVHFSVLQRIVRIFDGLRMFTHYTGRTYIFQIGLNLWRDKIIRSGRFRNTLQDLLHKERCAKVILPMRFVIRMLRKLSISSYEEEFEVPFLEVLAEFHRAESQRLMECCGDCADYLKEAERCIKEIEGVTLNLRLSKESEVKITNVVKKEIIQNPMLRIVTNGLSDAENLQDAVEYVQRLLDEKDKYDKIRNLAFNNYKTFQNALNSSFEYFINLNPRSPEFISLFVDDKLRKGLKGGSEEDIEIILDKAMMLFRYLQEKDVFLKYYKQHLAKRLLSGKTASDDAERSMLEKLKTECGNLFTAKLEVMFNDMKKSEGMMKGFYEATLAVQVLTTGAWPTQSSVTCNLPAELSSPCEKFRAYYLGAHTGRKLRWQTNMGTADIKATFGNGQKHELNVSTHQMCVLMLFNNADKLTYKDIEQATEIPSPNLKRCLQSLACVKGENVLHKEPMSKDIGEDDAFYVNEKFTSKLYKLKIGTIVAKKETEQEKQETIKRVEEDRQYAIDAAIIRIMKSRRILDHKSLITELTKQLQPRFLAKPVEIKKRIESLIGREYLERDNNNRKLYRYLA